MDRDTLLLNILLFFFPHFCPNYFISWKLPLEKNKLEVFVVFALPGWCFHSPVSGVGAWGFAKCQEPARKFQKYGGKNAVVSRVAQLEISKMLQELLSALSCGCRNSHRKNSDFFIIMHPKHAARFFYLFLNFTAEESSTWDAVWRVSPEGMCLAAVWRRWRSCSSQPECKESALQLH